MGYLPHHDFYLLLALFTTVFWVLYSLLLGMDVYHRNGTMRVLTRPRWVPARAALALHRTGLVPVCHAAPVALAAAALYPSSTALRVVAAATFTAYNFVDSSVTHSHRDHSSMFTCWALAVLPARWVDGAALGACLFYVAGSGFTKLRVGGRAWLSGAHMQTVLRYYAGFSLADFGPASPDLARLVASRRPLCRAIAVGTLALECGLVPASLFMPQHMRVGVAAALIALHLGIAVLQSFLIGLAFLPNVALYLLGFGAAVPPLTGPWFLAAAMGAAPALYAAVRGRLLPEEWPCTPYALFPWNDEQWRALFAVFAASDMRLALTPAHTAACDLRGRHVLEQCPPPAGSVVARRRGHIAPRDYVLDGWEQVVGETLLHPAVWAALRDNWQGVLLLAQASHPREAFGCDYDARIHVAIKPVLAAVQAWLASGRLLLTDSGQPLRQAFFVRVDERGVIQRVIAGPQSADGA